MGEKEEFSGAVEGFYRRIELQFLILVRILILHRIKQRRIIRLRPSFRFFRFRKRLLPLNLP